MTAGGRGEPNVHGLYAGPYAPPSICTSTRQYQRRAINIKTMVYLLHDNRCHPSVAHHWSHIDFSVDKQVAIAPQWHVLRTSFATM